MVVETIYFFVFFNVIGRLLLILWDVIVKVICLPIGYLGLLYEYCRKKTKKASKELKGKSHSKLQNKEVKKNR